MATGPSGQINIDLGGDGGGDGGGSSGGGGGISAGDVDVGDIDIQEPDDVDTSDGGDTGEQDPGDVVIGPEDIDAGDSGGDSDGGDSTPDDSVTGTEPGGGGTGPSGQGPDVGDVPTEVTGAPGKEPPGEPVGGRPDAVREVAPGQEPPQDTSATVRDIGRTQRQNLESQFEQTPGVGVDASDFETRVVERDGQRFVQTRAPQDVRLAAFGGATDFQRRVSDATADLRGGANVTAEQVGAVVEQQDDTPRGPPQENVVDVDVGGEPSIEQDTPFGQVTAAPGTSSLPGLDTGGGPISGPPGQLEQNLLGPLTGPPSETEQRITGGLEDAAQPFLGPPGEREQAVGGAFADVTQGIDAFGEQFTEETGSPFGGFVGETVATPAAEAARAFGDEDLAAGIESGAERFGEGVGAFPGEMLAAPEAVRQLGDLGFEATQDVTVQAASGEVPEAGERATFGISNAALAAGAGIASEVAENPFRSAGAITAGFAASFGAGLAIQRAPSVARAINIRARGGRIVDAADEMNQPRTLEGGLPGFSDDAMVSSRSALAEFESQTRTGRISGMLDEPVSFSGRAAEDVGEFGGFGRQFEAPFQETSMLLARGDPPGFFQSADLSTLRLPGGAESTSGPSIGLPRPNLRGGRVAAELSPDLDTMPVQPRQRITVGDEVIEAGQTPRATQELLGEIEFMGEQADPSSSFVRGATLTPEQEVIAPPGAEFQAVRRSFPGILDRVGPTSPTTSSEVFGRPLSTQFRIGPRAGDDITSSQIFGRPMTTQRRIGPAPSAPTTSPQVFGRPLTQDLDLEIDIDVPTPSPSAPTTSSQVFGRPLSTQFRTGPRPSEPTTLPEVFGRSPLQEFDVDIPAPSASEPTTSSQVFGRPFTQDPDVDVEIPTPPASEPITSPQIFGRPLTQDPDLDVDIPTPSASEPTTSPEIFGRPMSTQFRIGPEPSGETTSSQVFGRPLAREFRGTELFGIRAPSGEVVTGRLFERAAPGDDTAGAGGAAGTAATGETVSAESLAASSTRARRTLERPQPDIPIGPTVPTTGATTDVGGSTGSEQVSDPFTADAGSTRASEPSQVGGAVSGPSIFDAAPESPFTTTPAPTSVGGAATRGGGGVSEPTRPSEPTGLTGAGTSPFTEPAGVSEPPTSGGPSTPPPSEPSGPGIPSSPFTPSRPPSRPMGGAPPSEGGPPSTPFTPGGGGGAPPTAPLISGSDARGRDEEEEFIAPTGAEFVNPIADAGDLLGFGSFGGGGGSGSGGGNGGDSRGTMTPFGEVL